MDIQLAPEILAELQKAIASMQFIIKHRPWFQSKENHDRFSESCDTLECFLEKKYSEELAKAHYAQVAAEQAKAAEQAQVAEPTVEVLV